MPPPADKSQPVRGQRRVSVAVAFSEAIAKAEQDGAVRSDMTLHLTLNDLTELKRDRSLAIEDISFAAGQMRFKGVAVKGGGVTASALDLGHS